MQELNPIQPCVDIITHCMSTIFSQYFPHLAYDQLYCDLFEYTYILPYTMYRFLSKLREKWFEFSVLRWSQRDSDIFSKLENRCLKVISRIERPYSIHSFILCNNFLTWCIGRHKTLRTQSLLNNSIELHYLLTENFREILSAFCHIRYSVKNSHTNCSLQSLLTLIAALKNGPNRSATSNCICFHFALESSHTVSSCCFTAQPCTRKRGLPNAKRLHEIWCRNTYWTAFELKCRN